MEEIHSLKLNNVIVTSAFIFVQISCRGTPFAIIVEIYLSQ